MDKPYLPEDFKEFLRLLNSMKVKYLLIGGYAVGYYGYPRATADLDIWISMSPRNAAKMVDVLKEFGFDVAPLKPDLFLNERTVVRMGTPPLRLEILTTISGVAFDACFPRRKRIVLDGVKVNLIGLSDLKANKTASGRPKDLDDLQHLG
jgi:predicted nucleotidyltransferase